MIKQLSKRVSIFLCAAFLVALSVMPAFAAVSRDKYTDTYAIIDDAAYFPKEVFQNLCTRADKVGSETGIQIVIYSNENGVNESDMETYYEDFYNKNKDKLKSDCAMLVFDLGSHSNIILTYGKAKKLLDKGRMEEIKKEIKPDINNGDLSNAANTFMNDIEKYNSEPKIITSLKKVGWIGGIAGVVIAIIFVLVNVGRYKYNGKGGTYDLNKNSQMNLLDSQDVFVSKQTTYTEIQSSSNDSGGDSSPGSSGAF